MVELACDIATREDIMLLEQNVRLHEFYAEAKVADKQLQLDNEFHELLFTICNKQFSHEILGGMMAHFDRARTLSLSAIKGSKVISDHSRLVGAIKDKDKELAKSIITNHLSRYKTDENELRKQYPHYFKKT